MSAVPVLRYVVKCVLVRPRHHRSANPRKMTARRLRSHNTIYHRRTNLATKLFRPRNCAYPSAHAYRTEDAYGKTSGKPPSPINSRVECSRAGGGSHSSATQSIDCEGSGCQSPVCVQVVVCLISVFLYLRMRKAFRFAIKVVEVSISNYSLLEKVY